MFDTCHVYTVGQTRSMYILSTHISQAATVLPSDLKKNVTLLDKFVHNGHLKILSKPHIHLLSSNNLYSVPEVFVLCYSYTAIVRIW